MHPHVNRYHNRTAYCTNREDAMSEGIDAFIDAWERGFDPGYLYTVELAPDGPETIDLQDAIESAIEDDGLTAPGPETTELLSGRQLGV